MKDRPYFIALPEIVRVEMKTVISVLTAHFLSLAPSSGWHPRLR